MCLTACSAASFCSSHSHLPGQCQVSVVNRNLDGVGEIGPRLQAHDGVMGDVGIRPVHHLAHGDVVGHAADSANELGHALGGELLGVAVDEAGQCDDAVARADADGAGVDLGIPIELPDDGTSHANDQFRSRLQ